MVVPAVALTGVAPQSVKLSRKQRAIVSFIEQNPKFASFATASDLAERVGVHAATVVRLAQLLGYDGYPAFQEAIRHRYLSSLDAVAIMHAHAAVRHSDVALASIDQDIRNLSATRGALDGEAVRTVARLILGASRVLVVGMGSYGGTAIIFSHLNAFMGIDVEAEFRGNVTLATHLAAIRAGDVVLGIGAWWVVREVREALAVARERGATTVAIVDTPASPLAEVADHVLITRTASVSFFQSAIGPLAVLNALVAEIAAAGEPTLRENMNESTRLFSRMGVPWEGSAQPLAASDGQVTKAVLASSAEQPKRRRKDAGRSDRSTDS
jgi:DNA-binding MurR/RpiR family transcriptional regulator